MKKAFLLFLFSISVCLSLPAEPAEPAGQIVNWWVDKPILDFDFEGLKNVSLSQLFPFKNEYIGRNFTDDLYLEIYTALTELDYFERFEVYPVDPSNPENLPGGGFKKEVILRFVVYENPIIDNIYIKGNENIRSTDILAELISVVGDNFKRASLRVDRKAIELLYADKGYPETSVKSRYEMDEDKGRVVIFFDIQEGVKRVVKGIAFKGNSVISDFKLKSSIKLKVQSIAQEGNFDEILLENDKQIVQMLYFQKGYIRAEVVDVKRQIKKNLKLNQEELFIIFEIKEGDQYYFGGLDIFGNEIFSTEVLRAAMGMKPGVILDQIKLKQGFDRIVQLYFSKGYAYNEFTPFEMVTEDSHVISYRLTITERPRAHLEHITIKGLVKTEEFVIRRELPFQEGDVFSQSRIDMGLANIQRLGFFDKVEKKIERGSVPGLINLIIILEEGRSTDVQFGLNFAETLYDELPIHFFLQWKEKNLLGKAQQLSVGTELNASTQKLSFSFRERWLKDKPVSIGTSFGYEHNSRSMVYQDQLSPVGSGLPDPYEGTYYFTKETVVNGKTYKAGDVVDWSHITREQIETYDLSTDFDYFTYVMGEPISSDFLMKYERHSLFAGVDAGYTWNTLAGQFTITSGINFNLETNKYNNTLYRPLETWLQEHNNQWVWTNRWTTQFILNSRNHPYHPTNGFLLKQVFTYTGGILLGSTHYNKSLTTVEYYKTLFDIPVHDKWHYKTVLAMHSSMHLFLDQFFAEKNTTTGKVGAFTGTRDRIEDKLYTDRMNIMRGWDNKTNLEAIWENWIELRMPIYEKFIWADTFFEITGVWNDLSDMIPQSQYPHEALANNFYFTMGAGFRLTLQGFPIAVYMTKGFQVDYVNHVPTVNWQKGQFGNPDNTEDGGFNFVFRMMYSY